MKNLHSTESFAHFLYIHIFNQDPIIVSQDEKQSEQDREETNLSAEEIRQFFLDYHKRKQQSLGYLDAAEPGEVTAEPDGGGEEETFEPDKKPEIPRHVKYVTQVSVEILQCRVILCYIYPAAL